MTTTPGAASPRDAKELIDAGAMLLDVREDDEWEAGHVPDAVHIPLGQLGDAIDQMPRDRRIVAVCRSGGRSGQAANVLARLGYDVVNLTGGMNAWAREGLAVQTPAGEPGEVI